MSGPRLDPFVVATELVAHALRACPGEVALVACYGSRAAGTGSPESDLDLYYVPVEGANPGLCRQFVLDGLPYDFWPVSWDFLEGIANATSSRPWSVAAGLVGQARLLYARSEADRERFETLQARLKALTGPENRAAMRRRAAAAFGDVAAALGWLELAEGPDELARAGAELLNAACNCLGLLNQTAFTRGWGSNWPEVLALPIIPPGLEASAAVLLAGADAQAARVTGAGLAREVRDLIREPEASLPGEAPEAVFGGAYPFVVEYLSKVRSAAAAGDPNRARLAAV
ncbi:MAG TPA: nucleotidyltransferase domain-containing protein, partial [Deinococcales bacterium]|nr:nucleotidyltransferase domain-containing protein [Deinococcales bacterium]